MSSGELWLVVAIVVMLISLVALGICCRFYIKENWICKNGSTVMYENPEMRHSEPCFPVMRPPSASLPKRGIVKTSQDQIKNDILPIDTNCNREPNYVNDRRFSSDSIRCYIVPIESDYYNFDFNTTPTYGNVFNSRKLCAEAEYETVEYQNIWIGPADIENKQTDCSEKR